MPNLLATANPLSPSFAMPALSWREGLPLQGLTILAVEDSRYACEAMRLMCGRAGARMRRAETIAMARAHLKVYRPDVVIIDLGLPDGRGEALIRDLVLSQRRPSVILGTSGNPTGRASALASGADGFLDKPLESLSSFCATVQSHLPGLHSPALQDVRISPDPLALHDDLSRAAKAIAGQPDAAARRYVTGFLLGLAHHSHDPALARAAADAAQNGTEDLVELRSLLDERLAEPAAAFGQTP